MVMLADVIDAVVGADTHRDTHTLEIATATGITLATIMVSNTDDGSAKAVAWIGEHTPGPRVAAAVEGSRSYGVGLARALTAAGLPIIEIEQPRNRERRRVKSDAIDAHLAAMHALRLDTARLPTPRADGDREALRILLGARQELSRIRRRAINQLRALLLTGDDADRQLARAKQFSDTRLEAIIRRGEVAGEGREQTIRREEARRLAARVRETGAELTANTG
jgi:transposase